MACKFTEDDNVRFVELYVANECLWNTSSEQYKNKDSREAAYLDILREMNKVGLSTVKDVSTKIKNLRSTYYQELKKIKTSKKSKSSLYIPKVPWFSILNKHLRPFIYQRPTKELIYHDGKFSETKREMEDIDMLHDDADDDNTQEDNQAKTEIVYLESDVGTGQAERTFNCSISTKSQYNETIQNHTPVGKKRKITEIIQALDKLTDLTEKRSALSKGNDSFDILGQYVAATLKKLPMEIALEAEMGIHQLLHTYKMQALRDSGSYNIMAGSSAPYSNSSTQPSQD